MSDKRRAEIEAKRAKLESIRAAREARRKAQETERRTQAEGSSSRRIDVQDVNNLVDSLVGPSRTLDSLGEFGTPLSSAPGTPLAPSLSLAAPSLSGRASRLSDVGSDRISLGTTLAGHSATEHVVDHAITPRFVPDLIDIEQELFELPQKERVLYNKEIQTAVAESDEDEARDDEEDQQKLTKEHEKEMEVERLAREKELEEESIQLDKEIEAAIRELTEEEKTSIVTAPEFVEFIEQSSKFVQRALNDNYDYIRDYTVGTDAGPDDSEGKRVKMVCEFWDERYCKNRSITAIDWSPKFPELSVAAYNKNPAAVNEPDGIVAVWNLHLLERPEFVFHSQSDVLSVTFSPFHSNLVFGGTYSGQILLWDTRAKHLPVLKTPLSAAGHTHPVYAMQMVGTQNAHNLITSASDGTVCSWLVDMLAQPQETLELVHAGHNKTGEVAITALGFPDNETTTFFVGTEEGNVYQANRYDRAGAKAGLNAHDIYRGHAGPVTGLHFHPLHGPVDLSDLFLTCSVDWTVKLWRARAGTAAGGGGAGPGVVGGGTPGVGAGAGAGAGGVGAKIGPGGGVAQAQMIPPLFSFEEADDYVYDVAWHPVHPAVFGAVDGSGRFDVWNLNVDTEVPLVTTAVGSGRAINKLRWDKKEGRRAALGGSDGKLYIYDIGDIGVPRESEWDVLRSVVSAAGNVNGVELNGRL